mgnify:CR=1 FL=1
MLAGFLAIAFFVIPLKRRGIRVPDEVEVIGFDDIESSRFIGLSTVRVPTRELGRRAVQVGRVPQVGQTLVLLGDDS